MFCLIMIGFNSAGSNAQQCVDHIETIVTDSLPFGLSTRPITKGRAYNKFCSLFCSCLPKSVNINPNKIVAISTYLNAMKMFSKRPQKDTFNEYMWTKQLGSMQVYINLGKRTTYRSALIYLTKLIHKHTVVFEIRSTLPRRTLIMYIIDYLFMLETNMCITLKALNLIQSDSFLSACVFTSRIGFVTYSDRKLQSIMIQLMHLVAPLRTKTTTSNNYNEYSIDNIQRVYDELLCGHPFSYRDPKLCYVFSVLSCIFKEELDVHIFNWLLCDALMDVRLHLPVAPSSIVDKRFRFMFPVGCVRYEDILQVNQFNFRTCIPLGRGAAAVDRRSSILSEAYTRATALFTTMAEGRDILHTDKTGILDQIITSPNCPRPAQSTVSRVHHIVPPCMTTLFNERYYLKNVGRCIATVYIGLTQGRNKIATTITSTITDNNIQYLLKQPQKANFSCTRIISSNALKCPHVTDMSECIVRKNGFNSPIHQLLQ